MSRQFVTALSPRVQKAILDFEGIEPSQLPPSSPSLESLHLVGPNAQSDQDLLAQIGKSVKAWALEAERSQKENSEGKQQLPRDDAMLPGDGEQSVSMETVEKWRAGWMGSKAKTLEKAIELHRSGSSMTAFTLASSVIDRSLGDVVASASGKPIVPFLLRDILLTKELEDLLGKSMIAVLRTFMGPPIGMNLRNVLWHGFTTEEEFPRCYFNLLLSLVHWIGSRLEEQGLKVTERPLVDFSGFLVDDKHLEFLDDADCVEAISSLLSKSDLVVPSTESAWQKLLAQSQADPFLFYVGTLPMLEHCLRRVYARANNCPEKVVTANPDVFYTTMDEILARETEEGEANRLVEELGPRLMELLNDLYEHQLGPRLRDRVSHGEADPSSFTPGMRRHYLLLIVALMVKYGGQAVDSGLTTHPALQRAVWQASLYRSKYHPISLARDAGLRTFDKIEALAAFLKAHEEISTESVWHEGILLLQERASAEIVEVRSPLFLVGHIGDEAGCREQFRAFEIDTLFRGSKPLRLIVLVPKIFEMVGNILDEFTEKVASLSAAFRERRMGSHQRKNYATMQASAWFLVQSCLLSCLVAEGIILFVSQVTEEEGATGGGENSRTPTPKEADAKADEQLKRNPRYKLLKATLTSAERNLTNIRNNHWAKISEETITSLSPVLLKGQ